MKKLIVTLIVGSLLALPLSAMAMDAITSEALDGVSGQAGVTVAFCGASTTEINFSELSWGDPDGVGGCADSAGWLIIDGDVTITQEIASGETLVLDIATTGASTCAQCAGAISVPANTTFIVVGLPNVATSVSIANTLDIGLGNTAGTIDGTLGTLQLEDLDVITGTANSLYIWAHN
jgi:hypothetical protein